MPSHMQRTIKEQKDMGRICGIVERFIHNRKVGHGIRSDLFNIFDLLSIHPEQGVIGIQVCGPDFAQHYKKITEEHADKALLWLAAGRGRTKIEIWAWRYLLVKRGGKQRRWQSKVKRISYQDFKGKYTADAETEAA